MAGPEDAFKADPTFYPRMMEAIKAFLGRGQAVNWPEEMYQGIDELNKLMKAGDVPEAIRYMMTRNPAYNAYDAIMQQIGQMSASGDTSVRPWMEQDWLKPSVEGPWKRLSWLAQDVGNRQNVMSGMGDLAGRLAMQQQVQQPDNPLYDVFRRMYGLQPQGYGQL